MTNVIQFRPRQEAEPQVSEKSARDQVTREEIMEILASEVRAELTRRRTTANAN